MNGCKFLSNLGLSVLDVVGPTADVVATHTMTWILWASRQQETAVVCAIILGSTLPVRDVHSAWMSNIGARVWFPILLVVDSNLGLGTWFDNAAPSCCIVVAFIMWLRGMIKASLTVLDSLECQPCPSWAHPPTLVLRSSFSACGTDAIDDGSPGYAQS